MAGLVSVRGHVTGPFSLRTACGLGDETGGLGVNGVSLQRLLLPLGLTLFSVTSVVAAPPLAGAATPGFPPVLDLVRYACRLSFPWEWFWVLLPGLSLRLV